MHAATAVLVGLSVGLHAAIWGVFKDAPHEGFHWPRFVRSPVIGIGAALALRALLPWPDGVGGAVLLFGAAYAVERFIVETWKTFFRVEDQSKYTIPMQLAVLGRPVRSAGVRAVLGALYFAGGFGVLAGLRWLGEHAPDGAWPLLMLAATGLTIATLETWKKFSRPNEPGGKFAGKPVHFPLMLHYRYRLVPLYALICGTVALSVLASAYASVAKPCDLCDAAVAQVPRSAP